MNKIKVAIVDDHHLVSRALENLIFAKDEFEVVLNCGDGQSFLDNLMNNKNLPDVVLMDVNMPIKNGIDTTKEITEKYPDIKVIALTMEDDEDIVIQMLKAGAKGYFLKDMAPEILFKAIDIVSKNGTFYTDIVTQTLLHVNEKEEKLKGIMSDVKDTELQFIKLACSELTYKEIADKMCLSPRTIDGYRDSVFSKLNVKSRVGIVLFAIKNKIYVS